MRKNILVMMSIFNLFSTSPLFSQNPKLQVVETVPQSLKILSWNIYMLPFLSLFNSNGRRAEAIGKQLMDSDYQIVVFQEAFSSKCRRILKKKLSQKYPYQYGPANMPYSPFKTNSGLWILSTIPLTKLKEIKFHSATGFDKIAKKGAVLFKGNFHGAKFQLMSTHLQADYSSKIRQSQCKEIAIMLDEFYSSDIPQIICGDFNTEMSDTLNYTQILQTLNAQNGALSGNLHVTYDEINNNLARCPQGKGKVIDYIFTRNSHLIENIQRKILEFYNLEPDYKTHLSDHYAMEAIVRFLPYYARQVFVNY